MSRSTRSSRHPAPGQGKTLYAQPPLELSERVERIRALTNQSTTQIVVDALDLWTLLPPEAHIALRRIAQEHGRTHLEQVIEHFAHAILVRGGRQTSPVPHEGDDAKSDGE